MHYMLPCRTLLLLSQRLETISLALPACLLACAALCEASDCIFVLHHCSSDVKHGRVLPHVLSCGCSQKRLRSQLHIPTLQVSCMASHCPECPGGAPACLQGTELAV